LIFFIFCDILNRDSIIAVFINFFNKEFSMKNKIKLLGIIAIIAVIGFSFISCEEEITQVEETGGRLVINGLKDYYTATTNDGYIMVYGYKNQQAYEAGTIFLYGTDSISKDGKGNWVRIGSDGVVQMKIWSCTNALDKFTNYEENDQNVIIRVRFPETSSFYQQEVTLKVDFNKGTGTGTYTAP
jgi:hypothetical protein